MRTFDEVMPWDRIPKAVSALAAEADEQAAERAARNILSGCLASPYEREEDRRQTIAFLDSLAEALPGKSIEARYQGFISRLKAALESEEVNLAPLEEEFATL